MSRLSMPKTISILGAVVLLNASQPFAATQITVDSRATYQTIEGLGGFGGMRVWWAGDDPNTYYNANWIKLLVDTIGISVLRDDVPPCFEDPNDNSDPQVLDINSIDINSKAYGDDKFSTHVPYWVALKNAGVTKFIFSQWSPPQWMKTNGNYIGGGIKSDMYEEYAERTAAFCLLFKRDVGIEPYAIGVQNEPSLTTGYASCGWSADQLRLGLIAIGKRFRKEGITTKVFWPDDIIGDNGNNLWADYNSVISDTAAVKVPYAFATHYGNSRPWQPFWDSCAVAHGWKFWGTEEWCGGGPANNPPARDANGNDLWPAPLWTGMAISQIVQYGGSLFTFWMLGASTADNKADEALILNGRADKRAYVVRQYMRFIRPGAVKVKSTWSNGALDVMSFYLADQDIWTIVLMNTGSAPENVSISCNDPAFPSQLQMYQTTRNENCVDKGRVSPASITVPDTSVVTLVTRMPDLAVTVVRSRVRPGFAPDLQGIGNVSLYDLRGRCIVSRSSAGTSGYTQPNVAGVYVRVAVAKNGIAATEQRLSLHDNGR